MNKLKKKFRLVTPPLLWSYGSKVKTRLSKRSINDIFDGEGIIFKEQVPLSKCYLEYGSGDSTEWVIKHNTECIVISVESDPKWSNRVACRIDSKQLKMFYVDVGVVGNWGRPIGYEKSEMFMEYVKKGWDAGYDPDTVLIDGRFRVACFLYSTLQMKPGGVIIFDDYVGRTHYQVVEKFLKPKRLNGRQAVFIVPEINPETKELIQLELERFIMVMD
jgi:hypothetical protein